MTLQKSIDILKALADESRLAIVNSLMEKPQYVEELSERFDLAASTVSFHLKKLKKAGLIYPEKQQYYVIFHINRNIFDRSIKQLVSVEIPTRQVQDERIDQYKQKVLNAFFENGRLTRLPAQHKKRIIVLDIIARSFERGRVYPESDVNELISVIYEDYCTIRRLMVDEGYMSREHGEYRLVRESPKSETLNLQKTEHIKTMDKRKELINAYKQTTPPMGILQIKNKKNGKIFICSSVNIPGIINRYRFQLKLGSHKNRDLQNDWNEFGEDSFEFETLEAIEPKADPGWKAVDELSKHKEFWLEQLQPFGDRGYNSKPFNM